MFFDRWQRDKKLKQAYITPSTIEAFKEIERQLKAHGYNVPDSDRKMSSNKLELTARIDRGEIAISEEQKKRVESIKKLLPGKIYERYQRTWSSYITFTVRVETRKAWSEASKSASIDLFYSIHAFDSLYKTIAENFKDVKIPAVKKLQIPVHISTANHNYIEPVKIDQYEAITFSEIEWKISELSGEIFIGIHEFEVAAGISDP